MVQLHLHDEGEPILASRGHQARDGSRSSLISAQVTIEPPSASDSPNNSEQGSPSNPDSRLIHYGTIGLAMPDDVRIETPPKSFLGRLVVDSIPNDHNDYEDLDQINKPNQHHTNSNARNDRQTNNNTIISLNSASISIAPNPSGKTLTQNNGNNNDMLKVRTPSISSPVNQRNKKPTHGKWGKIPGLGLVLSGIAGVIFATNSLFVSMITSVNPIEVLVIGSYIQFLVYIIIIVKQGYPLFGYREEWIPLVARAVVGVFRMSFAYVAYTLIPIGDASAIIFSAPVYVNFFACVFLREPCGVMHIVTTFTTLIGVVLISRPSFLFGNSMIDAITPNAMLGVLMAFLASIAFSLQYVALRKVQRTPSPVVIMWFSAACVIGDSVALLLMGEFSLPSSSKDGLLILGVGACGVIGHFFVTMSLKLEEAGPVSLARSLDIVVSYIYQVTISCIAIQWTSLIGAILVMGCALTVTAMKFMCPSAGNFGRIDCNRPKPESIKSKFPQPKYDDIEDLKKPLLAKS